MKIIRTDQMIPSQLKRWERDQVYNGLDCCVTWEVLDVLLPQLDDITNRTYAFSRALQGPVLEMRMRGVLIDRVQRAEVIEQYFSSLDLLERNLERIVQEGCGVGGFNWGSTVQLRDLFYNTLEIPEIKSRKTGQPTVDRKALERLDGYPQARPIVRYVIKMRELKKRIESLQTAIDPDSRIRTSYNIAGTTTGRFSSSLSEFGTGGNLQNIEESLRRAFIADPGKKMGYFDAEQGESRVVGAIEWNLFQDSKYLDACESGDLHTTVAKMVWPGLDWTGNPEADRSLAEQPYYRHYSRRFMCKKLGHGSNYGGRPPTLSAQTNIELRPIQEFQGKYFLAFPAHIRWHAWVGQQIRNSGTLTSLMGRRRQFWGRRTSDDTVREALAFDPQGSLVDIVNQGMLQVWRARDCELLMQNHDAIVVQYPEEREAEIVSKILSQLRYPVTLRGGREFIIPYGAKTGWNFGEFGKDNPDGLKTYNFSDSRKRTPQASLLDRPVRTAYRKS